MIGKSKPTIVKSQSFQHFSQSKPTEQQSGLQENAISSASLSANKNQIAEFQLNVLENTQNDLENNSQANLQNNPLSESNVPIWFLQHMMPPFLSSQSSRIFLGGRSQRLNSIMKDKLFYQSPHHLQVGQLEQMKKQNLFGSIISDAKSGTIDTQMLSPTLTNSVQFQNHAQQRPYTSGGTIQGAYITQPPQYNSVRAQSGKLSNSNYFSGGTGELKGSKRPNSSVASLQIHCDNQQEDTISSQHQYGLVEQHQSPIVQVQYIEYNSNPIAVTTDFLKDQKCFHHLAKLKNLEEEKGRNYDLQRMKSEILMNAEREMYREYQFQQQQQQQIGAESIDQLKFVFQKPLSIDNNTILSSETQTQRTYLNPSEMKQIGSHQPKLQAQSLNELFEPQKLGNFQIARQQLQDYYNQVQVQQTNVFPKQM